MRLIAKFLECCDTILAEIESGRDIAPFFRRKEKRSIAEADIQPASPLCITRDTFDHSRRNWALAFHVVTDGLIGLCLRKKPRDGACIEIALGKDMFAGAAFVPGHNWRKVWMVDWMFRAIGAKDRRNIAAFAGRRFALSAG